MNLGIPEKNPPIGGLLKVIPSLPEHQQVKGKPSKLIGNYGKPSPFSRHTQWESETASACTGANHDIRFPPPGFAGRVTVLPGLSHSRQEANQKGEGHCQLKLPRNQRFACAERERESNTKLPCLGGLCLSTHPYQQFLPVQYCDVKGANGPRNMESAKSRGYLISSSFKFQVCLGQCKPRPCCVKT